MKDPTPQINNMEKDDSQTSLVTHTKQFDQHAPKDFDISKQVTQPWHKQPKCSTLIDIPREFGKGDHNTFMDHQTQLSRPSKH